MSNETQVATATQTQENYGFEIKNAQAEAMFPELKKDESRIVVAAFGEPGVDKSGKNVVPAVLMQKTKIGSGDANSRALVQLLGWSTSRTLRTIQNLSSEIANSLSIGDNLPEELNLEIRRSIIPFYDNQEPVELNGVPQHYYNNTVVVEGTANHHSVPEAPEDLD